MDSESARVVLPDLMAANARLGAVVAAWVLSQNLVSSTMVMKGPNGPEGES